MKPNKVLVVFLGGRQINALVLTILSESAASQGPFVSRLAMNCTTPLTNL